MTHRLLIVLAFLMLPLSAAHSFETRATAAYVIDQTTGTVLLAKNASKPLPPASMSKLMTLYMALEAVEDGRLSMDEELLVSQYAMNYGGSTLFLRRGERVSVADLIRGIIILSGNDACAVIAEALSVDGTEAGFAKMMTARARQLGMMDSNFTNSNGWPAPDHRMSMRDLGTLADLLIKDFPQHYPLFAQREFLFDPTESSNRLNRNPLLALDIGADGLKTGHTQEAGYGLVGSAKQGGRRVILVITGLQTAAERAEEAERIVDWAFRQFAQKDIITAGTKVADAEVWNGDLPLVGLAVAQDLSMLLPVLAADRVNAEVAYTGPIEAPILKDDVLAELVVSVDGLPDTRIPLVAEHDVSAGGFLSRMRTASRVVIRKIAGPTVPLMAAN
ncbi:D-alanyl-D-alanine carboxypeptidase family protein [Nereida sp.]|uniref:D-alanyl-D-alanine carboxypeptidase family protein n=1 Tax=Nereida sp. TaxID=2736090 RepID=UPI003F699322